MKLLRSGRNNAISVKALAAETGMGSVEIRQTVRDLIMEHGILIGSAVGNPPGYFIPETAEEATTATRSLLHRGIMILARVARMRKSSLELVFNQGRLEFEEVSK